MEQNLVVMTTEQLNELITTAIQQAVTNSNQPTILPDLMDEHEVREILKVAHSTLWLWGKRGILKPNKIGGRNFWNKKDVLSLIG